MKKFLGASTTIVGGMLAASCVTTPYDTAFSSCEREAAACYQLCEEIPDENGYVRCQHHCDDDTDRCFDYAYQSYRTAYYDGYGYSSPWYGRYGQWYPNQGYYFSPNGYDRYGYRAKRRPGGSYDPYGRYDDRRDHDHRDGRDRDGRDRDGRDGRGGATPPPGSVTPPPPTGNTDYRRRDRDGYTPPSTPPGGSTPPRRRDRTPYTPPPSPPPSSNPPPTYTPPPQPQPQPDYTPPPSQSEPPSDQRPPRGSPPAWKRPGGEEGAVDG